MGDREMTGFFTYKFSHLTMVFSTNCDTQNKSVVIKLKTNNEEPKNKKGKRKQKCF